MENAVKSTFSLTEGMTKPQPTIDTFLSMLNETFSGSIRYNVLTGRPEILDDASSKWLPWTDTQDSALRWYFQCKCIIWL